jgi:hypothetical protein
MKVCPVQRYGLARVLAEYERSGTVLGTHGDELEGYHWPLDGKHYGPEEKPRVPRDVSQPAGVQIDYPPKLLPAKLPIPS